MKTIMWKYSLGSTDDVWVEERNKEGKKEQSQTKIPYLNSPPKIGGIRAQRTVRGLCTDLFDKLSTESRRENTVSGFSRKRN